jgi:hypothetical protein
MYCNNKPLPQVSYVWEGFIIAIHNLLRGLGEESIIVIVNLRMGVVYYYNT